MSESSKRIRHTLECLAGLDPPLQPEAEAWARFAAERQELVDDLQYLAERFPDDLDEIIAEGGRELVEASCQRIEEGMHNLAFEAKAVQAECSEVRKRRHKLAQHQRFSGARPTESSVSSVG